MKTGFFKVALYKANEKSCPPSDPISGPSTMFKFNLRPPFFNSAWSFIISCASTVSDVFR